MDEKKYHDCLDIADRCLKTSDSKAACALWDELMCYIQENFPAPEVKKTKEYIPFVKEITKCKELDTFRKIPPSYPEELHAIALTSFLVKSKLPIDPNYCKKFDWFHKTYGWVITSLDAK
jgi:hypothetical protein